MLFGKFVRFVRSSTAWLFVRGHFSIVDGLRRDSKALQQIGGDGDLRKALEIDADSIATSLMLMLSLKQMDIEGRSAEMSDVEVFTGKFGTNSKNTKQLVTFIPVTAMNYTIFDQTFIADDVREARALTHKVLSKIGLANTTSK